ncbi:MAG TPA: hypothetical protein PKL83_04630 [bacterium]|nr:hypothetical protein [bacterium]
MDGINPQAYQQVVETDTHYYVTYSLFYPRDYESARQDIKCSIDRNACHENDMETVVLAIEKNADGGKIIAAFASPHGKGTFYVFDDAVQVNPAAGHVEIVHLPAPADGRIMLRVEAGGHGIEIVGEVPDGAGDILMLKLQGADAAPVIPGVAPWEYGMRGIYEDLWLDALFADWGSGNGRYADFFPYLGVNLPGAMRGDKPAEVGWAFDDKAHWPWAHKRDVGERGDPFIDPDRFFRANLAFPGIPPESPYVWNPFLQAIEQAAEQLDAQQP